MTLYEKMKENYGKKVGDKPIRRFCPSDFCLDYDTCDPDGNETKEMCEKCWNQEYKEP